MGKPLAYAVTAKGKLTSGGSLATFRPHLWWLAASLTLLTASVGFGLGESYPTLTFWLFVTVVTCAAPLVIHAHTQWRARSNREVAPQLLGLPIRSSAVELPIHSQLEPANA
jgi:hypothetical protein